MTANKKRSSSRKLEKAPKSSSPRQPGKKENPSSSRVAIPVVASSFVVVIAYWATQAVPPRWLAYFATLVVPPKILPFWWKPQEWPYCSDTAKIETSNCPERYSDYFWNNNDWGLVEKYRSQLETRILPGQEASSSSSSLRCNGHSQYCEAKRVMLDTGMSDMTIFDVKGQWNTTIEALRPWDGDVSKCDEHFTEKSIMLKPDMPYNYYHTLCDYINIYASMHIPEDWYPPPPSSRNKTDGWYREGTKHDLKIIMAPGKKSPEDTFRSNFLSLYKPYTSKPVLALNRHWQEGNTLCFDDLVLSLNPRGGPHPVLFFNMPVPGDCRNSRLFRDWISYMTENHPSLAPHSRMGWTAGSKRGKPIRLGLLTRNSGTGMTSGTRHLVNQDELLQAVRDRFGSTVEVKLLDFDWSRRVPIETQLREILNADILASMHGAGLAHVLFLPPWGVAYEIYNCQDPKCYNDLSRLIGVKYMTGERGDVTKVKPTVHVEESRLETNDKFWNYIVDTEKFVSKIQEAVDYITGNPSSPFYNGC